MIARLFKLDRRARRGVVWATLALVGTLVIAGCGYQQSGDFNREPQGLRPPPDDPASTQPAVNWDGAPRTGYQWRSLYREDIQTVAVPIFQSKDFRRGVEFKLSKAVVNSIESHSPYKVVPKERADTVLEGEVLATRVQTLSRAYNNNVPQEQLMILTVNFTWKDLRTGRILLERRNFQQTATWYPTLGEGEFVGEQTAVERLGLAIARELQADW